MHQIPDRDLDLDLFKAQALKLGDLANNIIML